MKNRKDIIRIAGDENKIYDAQNPIESLLGLDIGANAQLARGRPNGRLKYGTLTNEDFWTGIEDLDAQLSIRQISNSKK